MCTEDASRLPKFPTYCHPPHAAIIRPVHSAGPHPPPPSSLSDPLPSRARHHCLRHAPPPFGHADASLATRVSLFHPPTLHTATLAPWGSFGCARGPLLRLSSPPPFPPVATRLDPRPTVHHRSTIPTTKQLSCPVRSRCMLRYIGAHVYFCFGQRHGVYMMSLCEI
jgi:hypothetical protein